MRVRDTRIENLRNGNNSEIQPTALLKTHNVTHEVVREIGWRQGASILYNVAVHRNQRDLGSSLNFVTY